MESLYSWVPHHPRAIRSTAQIGGCTCAEPCPLSHSDHLSLVGVNHWVHELRHVIKLMQSEENQSSDGVCHKRACLCMGRTDYTAGYLDVGDESGLNGGMNEIATTRIDGTPTWISWGTSKSHPLFIYLFNYWTTTWQYYLIWNGLKKAWSAIQCQGR